MLEIKSLNGKVKEFEDAFLDYKVIEIFNVKYKVKEKICLFNDVVVYKLEEFKNV